MITVRNTDDARSLTVRAGEALEVGMLVKLAQGAAAGAPPAVVKALQADLADPTVMVGVVDFIVDDSEAVDYLIHSSDETVMDLNSGADATFKIPANAQCNVWWNQPEVGFDIHSTAIADLSTVREPAAVTVDALTSKITLVTFDATTGAPNEEVLGLVYRNEGPEITVILTAI